MQESTVPVVSAGLVVTSLIVGTMGFFLVHRLIYHLSLAESFRIASPAWRALDPVPCYTEIMCVVDASYGGDSEKLDVTICDTSSSQVTLSADNVQFAPVVIEKVWVATPRSFSKR